MSDRRRLDLADLVVGDGVSILAYQPARRVAALGWWSGADWQGGVIDPSA